MPITSDAGRRMPAHACLLLAGAILLSACGPDEGPGPRTAPAQVALSVDGTIVAHVGIDGLAERRALPDLLPAAAGDPGTWAMLAVHRADGRVLKVRKPTAQFPDRDFCLYASKSGKPSFGAYRREEPGMHPRMRELLDQPAPFMEDVARINVRTVETDEEKRFDALFGTLTLVVDGGAPRSITPAMLDGVPVGHGAMGAVPKEELDGSRGLRPLEWRLAAVLGLAVDPARIESVRVLDINGNERTVRASELAPDAPLTLVLKRNRKGDLHLRVLEGAERKSQMRSVVRFEIRTRAASEGK